MWSSIFVLDLFWGLVLEVESFRIRISNPCWCAAWDRECAAVPYYSFPGAVPC